MDGRRIMMPTYWTWTLGYASGCILKEEVGVNCAQMFVYVQCDDRMGVGVWYYRWRAW